LASDGGKFKPKIVPKWQGAEQVVVTFISAVGEKYKVVVKMGMEFNGSKLVVNLCQK